MTIANSELTWEENFEERHGSGTWGSGELQPKFLRGAGRAGVACIGTELGDASF